MNLIKILTIKTNQRIKSNLFRGNKAHQKTEKMKDDQENERADDESNQEYKIQKTVREHEARKQPVKDEIAPIVNK